MKQTIQWLGYPPFMETPIWRMNIQAGLRSFRDFYTQKIFSAALNGTPTSKAGPISGMGIPLIRNHWAFYKYGDIIVDTAKIDVWWVWAVFSMLGRNSLLRISFTDEIKFTEFPQIWSDLTVSVKALAIEISWKFLSQNVPPSFAAFRRSTFLQTSLEQYYPLSSWSLAGQKGGNDLVPRSQMNCFSPVRMRDIVKLGGARCVAPFWERTCSCQKLKSKSGKDLPRVKGIVQCFFTQSISALATGHDVMGPQLATCPVPDAADQCRGSLRRLCCDLGLGQYPEFNPDPVTVRRLQYKIVTENYPSSIWSCVFSVCFPMLEKDGGFMWKRCASVVFGNHGNWKSRGRSSHQVTSSPNAKPTLIYPSEDFSWGVEVPTIDPKYSW